MSRGAVLTIGNFDGVHLGHAALLQCACAHAARLGPAGRVAALVFDPSPMTVLRPGQAPAMLTTFDRRAALLRQAGADEVVRITPTPELLGLAPEAFIEQLVGERHPAAIVEGPDFRFGRSRSGDVNTLRKFGERLGFIADIVPPVEVALTDQTIVTASSTVVRWLVAHGRVRDAALVLGRPYALSGVVGQGDRRGREIGCPTANLVSGELTPMDGVYAARAHLADGRCFGAAVHIGPRATFDSAQRTIEAHILDWSGPVAEGQGEYGWPLQLEFVSWLRDQAKFDSVHELMEQIERDIVRTRQLLSRDAIASHHSTHLREATV